MGDARKSVLCLPMSIHWRLRHCLACLSQRRARPTNPQWPDFFLPRPLEKAASASLPPPRYRPSNVSLANPWPRPHHPRTRRMDQRCWSIHPQLAINFCAKQESSFGNKPDIGQTKKSKGITCIMRAFLGIREKADSPLAPNILTPVAQGSYVGRRRTRWW
ncbi:hypothetical protein BKA70DRAFT_344838 [Coprinopsis sp. MPI-PUGE-AT-0042]|nr:hypothetical protein BKA70DRAFT_344838 [Coprinopsis sp. MPI-PUGE-AT-0042]